MTSRLNWLFRNRSTGRITIGQPPNTTIKVAQGATLVGVLLPKGRVRDALSVVAVGALTVWAGDELVRGVNPFRRISGLLALAALAHVAFRPLPRAVTRRLR